MNEQVILESTPLNALDRCDRCGAQAYVRATLATGGELMFCAHHGKEYAEKLKTVAVRFRTKQNVWLNLRNKSILFEKTLVRSVAEGFFF